MDNLKLVSSKIIHAAVNRDFRVSNQGWYADANIWIGNGLLEMGTFVPFIKQTKSVKVINNIAKLPCDAESIINIIYCLKPLDRLSTSLIRIGQSDWYSVKNGRLEFSFEKGDIEINYLTIPFDCDNYVMIPDNIFVIDALKWKCMMQLCLQGLTHPVVNYEMAHAEWDEKKGMAANQMELKTPDELSSILTNFNSFFPLNDIRL